VSNAASEVARGRLEPGGQLVLTLTAAEQAAAKADIAELTTKLGQVEHLLGAVR
jgi:hypothetical protein